MRPGGIGLANPIGAVVLLIGGAVWLLIIWAAIPRVEPLRTWLQGDATTALVVSGIVLLTAPVTVLLSRTESAVIPSTMVTLALVVAMVMSHRFTNWVVHLPLWVRVLGVYFFGFYPLVVAIRLADVLAPQAPGLIKIIFGPDHHIQSTGVVAAPFGAILYYLVGASAWAVTTDKLDFWRHHLFDGFSCAGYAVAFYALLFRKDLSRTDWWTIAIRVSLFSAFSGLVAGAATLGGGTLNPATLTGSFATGALFGLILALIGTSRWVRDAAYAIVRFWVHWARAIDKPVSTVLASRGPDA
jgi:hypothetical protein